MSDKSSSKSKKKFSIFPWDWDVNDRPASAKPPASKSTSKSSTKSKEKPREKKEKEPKSAPKPAPRLKKEVIYDTSIHNQPQIQTRPADQIPPSPSFSFRKSTTPSPRIVLREQIITQKMPDDSRQNSDAETATRSVGKVDRVGNSGGRSLAARSHVSRSALPVEFDGDLETDCWTGGDDLTFEKAVLALIRLRRIEARLLKTRDHFVKEMQSFRGWEDERFVNVLDQIAKSNHQLDELEPLITSLEAFIKEDQTPSYMSEDLVLRYPVQIDQRNQVPQNRKKFGHSYGRKTTNPIGRSHQNISVTDQLSPEELEREVEELRMQVKQLQLDKRSQNPNGRIEMEDGFVVRRNPEMEDPSRTQFPRQTRLPDTALAPPRSKGHSVPRSFQSAASYSSDSEQRRFVKTKFEASGTSEQSSDELSVDVNSSVDRYEDFRRPTTSRIMPKNLRDSLSKLDDLMREFEASQETSPVPFPGGKWRNYSPSPVRPPFAKMSEKRRADLPMDYRNVPKVTSSTTAPENDEENEEEIGFEKQLRLESPDEIEIPHRYVREQDGDRETAYQTIQRQAKAENIRKRLAQPESSGTREEQREREKVLLMTPILAREVKERSRAFALRARAKAQR